MKVISVPGDYLHGVAAARDEIDRYAPPRISLVTWMEVLVGAVDEDHQRVLRRFLNRFAIHDISREIAEDAVVLRRTHRLRLPDAIIWATAQSLGALLVTRNTRDFPANAPGVRVPYHR